MTVIFQKYCTNLYPHQQYERAFTESLTQMQVSICPWFWTRSPQRRGKEITVFLHPVVNFVFLTPSHPLPTPIFACFAFLTQWPRTYFSAVNLFFGSAADLSHHLVFVSQHELVSLLRTFLCYSSSCLFKKFQNGLGQIEYKIKQWKDSTHTVFKEVCKRLMIVEIWLLSQT